MQFRSSDHGALMSALQGICALHRKPYWADIRARIAQLQPNLDKTLYRVDLMELTAPQDGNINRNQGKRSVLEYLLAPVQKAVHEAGRGR